MDSPFPVGFSKPGLYLVFLFLFLFHQLPYALSHLEPLHCDTLFQCGNIKAGFPFWGENRPEHCGIPWLKLECDKGSNKTTLFPFGVRYYARQIDNTNNTFKLARKDFSDDVCPPQLEDTLEDTRLFPSIFEYLPGYKNLTVFYSCYPHFQYLQNLTCPSSGLGSEYSNPEYHRRCVEPVNITVPASFVLGKESWDLDHLKSVLKEGFWVKLKIDQKVCEECLSPGGTCDFGYTRQFCCLNNSSLGSECQSGSPGLSHRAIVGIGIAGGVMGVLLVAGGLWLVIHQRRKKMADGYRSKDLAMTPPSSRGTSAMTSTTVSRSLYTLQSLKSDIGKGSVYFGVQVFSYAELEEATENFSRELGDGGFGIVYYGELKDGRAVAVKRLYENTLKRVEQFRNEIEILKSLKHPNLVILYGCTSRHSRELLLVYEYIPNGTLADHLHGERAKTHFLSWPVRLDVAIETASALCYLHASGIIHRDVKTTNILLDNNFQVKVADFGLSRLFPTDVTHVSTAPQGTPGYVDPEYYQCYRLNEKSDVYSFGVILAELISSKEAVDITRHRHDINLANMAISRIQNDTLHELVDPSLGFEKDCSVRRMVMSVAELAFRCLQQEREVRPSMDEIVEVLKGIKKEEMCQPPEVVDINGCADEVGLLRNNAPPPLSPETDKWASSSNTTGSSF